nr:MAG TPA: hypothetical protein [Caudoviricetes sp.]
MQQCYSITVGGLSSCKLTLREGENSPVVLPFDTGHRLVLNQGEQIGLTVRDTQGDAFALHLDGLVSDKQVIDLAGSFVFEVLTDAASLNFPVNLKTNSDPILELESGAVDLVLVRNLSGQETLEVSAVGSMTVHKVLDGGEAFVSAGTTAAKISAAVFTVIADWTEHTLAEMTEKTLDELAYKEV